MAYNVPDVYNNRKLKKEILQFWIWTVENWQKIKYIIYPIEILLRKYATRQYLSTFIVYFLENSQSKLSTWLCKGIFLKIFISDKTFLEPKNLIFWLDNYGIEIQILSWRSNVICINILKICASYVKITVKPAHAVTSIKQSPFSSPVIENFIWIKPLLRGHLSYKATFSLFRMWPLNTALTLLFFSGFKK